MRDSSKRPQDWFRWIVALSLLLLTGLTAYNSVELRRLQQELKRLHGPRAVPLADARGR